MIWGTPNLGNVHLNGICQWASIALVDYRVFSQLDTSENQLNTSRK
jgi:hypothetical protein